MKGKLFCILLVHVNLSLSLSLHVKFTIHNFLVPTTWELNFECASSKFKLIQQKLCRDWLGCHDQCFFLNCQNITGPQYLLRIIRVCQSSSAGDFPWTTILSADARITKWSFQEGFLFQSNCSARGVSVSCFLFLIRTVMIWFRALLPICMPFLISAPH